MPTITFNGQDYAGGESETVLDVLSRHGVPIPFSCKSGVCQSCLVRAVEGRPGESAQKGLKETLRLQNYFLACACVPDGNMTVELPPDAGRRLGAKVLSVDHLAPAVVRLRLQKPDGLSYRPGQFITLYKNPSLGRSYSLASLPQTDDGLELHIRLRRDGRLSNWIGSTLQTGETVDISPARGNSFYTPDKPQSGLLLIGTGTGLAPLYGILRDALHQGHQGPIHLFHGSRHCNGLYLVEELHGLAAEHENFRYTPCLSGGVGDGFAAGRADEVALSRYKDLAGWRVYLCGHPNMVKQAGRRAFLAGARMGDIYSDAFTADGGRAA